MPKRLIPELNSLVYSYQLDRRTIIPEYSGGILGCTIQNTANQFSKKPVRLWKS